MKMKKKLLALLSVAMVMQTIPSSLLQIHAKVSDSNKELIFNGENAYDSIKKYWSTELIGDMKGLEHDENLQDFIKKLDKKAQNYLDTMLDPATSNQLWNDEVFSTATEAAKATEALDRLKMIAIQTLEPTSLFYNNEKSIEQVKSGLRFILDNKYGPETSANGYNWWDKEIGAPKALVDLGILYYDKLDDKTIGDILKTIDRFIPYADRRGTSPNGMKETGANLVDKVAIVIKRAALDGNEERMSHAKKCIAPLFSYSNSGDGYYPDGSFIQHGNIPYNGSYGYVLLNELTNCIIMLNFTDYKIDRKDIEFYENTLLNHYIPFLSYGGNIVDGVRGRAVSRKSQQGDTMGMQTMGVLLQYADIAATDETKYEIYESLKGMAEKKFSEEQMQDFSLLAYSDYIRVKNLSENKLETAMERNSFNVYSYMDRIVSNRDSYTFTVSANSSRMSTEAGNSENILGRYQGQGYTQLYNNDINQYNDDYNATVDQKRLAGVTTAHQNLGFKTQGQSKWSGGSTLDGKNGVSGFELIGEKNLTELKINDNYTNTEIDTGVKSGITAKKSYFVFGNKIVYLGSDISNLEYDKNIDFVESIVENRKVFDGMNLIVDGNKVVSTNGSTSIINPTSAYLSGKTADTGIGYVFLEEMNLDVKRETRNGAWSDVNKLPKFTNNSPVSNDFISMSINHGKKPKIDTYSWIVMPDASESDIKNYLENPTIEIIENSKIVQAVKDEETNQFAYNFFGAGETKNKSISVSGSASIVMQENKGGYKLAVSEPTRSQSFVDITLNGIDNLKHVGIINGSADIVFVDGDSVTIRVKFSSKDGQPRNIEIGTVYETTTDNLALNKKSEASSVVQNAVTSQRISNFAVDGKADTRWASNYERSNKPITKEEADTGWFAVDLGETTKFNQIKISWEWALSNDYEIQVSNDVDKEDWNEKEWETVANKKDNTGYKELQRKDDILFEEVNARYVRMKSNIGSRPIHPDYGPVGGLSIYEFEIYNKMNYDKIITEAKKILKLYPVEMTGKQSEFDRLKIAVEIAERLIEENPNFTQEELRRVLLEVDNAMTVYKSFIVPVTGIKGNKMTILAGKEDQLSYEITPKSATNKNVYFDNKNPNLVKIDKDGTVHALKSGTANVVVTTQDGDYTTEVAITVNSNNPPTIIANDIIIKVGSVFEPLKYATAKDEEDGDIQLTKDNVIKNTVNTSKKGSGIVTYQVTDQDGNSVEKTITVVVEEDKIDIVDKTKLKEIINVAKEVNITFYTEKSIKVFEVALSRAEEVFKDDKVTQEEVDQATRELYKAYKELDLKEDENAMKPETEKGNDVQTGVRTHTRILVGLMGVTGVVSILICKKKREDER